MPEQDWQQEWDRVDRELTEASKRLAREDQERAEEERRRNQVLGGGPSKRSGGSNLAKYGGCGCGSLLAVGFVILLIFVFVVPALFGQPKLASAYKGTLLQTDGNKTAVFTLTSVKEGQSMILTSNNGNLTAQATFSPALIPNGTLSGTITPGKTMDFTISGFYFQANLVNSVKTLSGNYFKQVYDPKTNTETDTQLGTWQLTALS